MNVTHWLGRLLGYKDVSRIDHWQTSFGAAWAHETPALVLFLCLGVSAIAFWFYLRWQVRGHRPARLWLAMLRAAILTIIVIILADPILEITLVSRPKPVMWLLFDGTDSMAIPDELPKEDENKLKSAVGWDDFVAQHPRESTERPARSDFVRAMLSQHDSKFLTQLADKFELKAFTFQDTDGVRSLLATDGDNHLAQDAGAKLVSTWTTEGTVTALGDAFNDLAARHASDNLSGVIVFSDFDQNAGTIPLAAAKKLSVPIFAVGVGPLNAVDLSVDLLAPPTMKSAETSVVSVTVRQREVENRSLEVRLFVHPPAQNERETPPKIPVGSQTVVLNAASASVEFPYTPSEPGRFVFEAEVDPIAGEAVVENNRAERDVTIIDDFLRLMYVEYEPTWEWRFVKEVFHRDKLVGMRGFRTFLRSADPIVRETNELFVPGLTLPRSEFFQSDVIFLGDMPASALSTRFCEMTKEFVSQFGGGLVVIAGPRFGPAQLASTPLADMLPVVVDPDLRRKDDKEFRLNLTPLSQQYDFMRLGREPADNLKAWNNMGKLPWYQPVVRPEARSTTVLAEHPTDFCADGKTKQPLIAVRKYGRGEVVYIGFNEMWRLRRMYGEEYYRQFWGQMIYRLGLSHALGSHKRFVVRTDKQKYRAGEMALITVEAFDKDFQPLDEKELADGRLLAEFIVPDRQGAADRVRSITVPQLRQGVFETRIPVTTAGEYRLRVTDPIDRGEAAEVNFEVSGLSVERRSAVRNAVLQRSLAAETNGKAYDLTDVAALPDQFDPPRRQEQTVEVFPLWSTWLSFIAVIGLMLAEWFGRKLVNLA